MDYAYRIMKKLIQDKSREKNDLFNMADVYYASKRLTQEQYEDIVNKIEQMEQ